VAQITLEEVVKRVEALEQKVGCLLSPDADPPGTEGDPQDDDPESVARWIAEANSIPPLTMTAEEEAEWQAARAAQKQLDAAAMDRLIADLPGSQP